MNRLNYFNPYQTRSDSHEDQFTRALLVLMRYSFPVLSSFYDQCLLMYGVNRDAPEPDLPAFTDLLDSGWQIETQQSNPAIQTNYLLSVLITDDPLSSLLSTIKASQRNARYDGVVTFGDELTIIIENKPRSSLVWFDQLRPSRQNLSENTRILLVPVLLSWRSIVEWLTKLLTIPSVSGTEKLLISDFLAYVDDHYPFLNPYHRFDLCKGNSELIQRRIKTLLESVVVDPASVKYHRGWGHYIETPYQSIKKIGLLHRQENGRWWLELSLYAGDTVSQARALYSQPLQLDPVETGWWLKTNYHVSFQASNLVWFTSTDEQAYDVQSCVAYWQEHPEQIRQLNREEVPAYLAELEKQGIICINETMQANLDRKFTRTNMQTLNSCPGIGLFYRIEDIEAGRLDQDNQIAEYLTKRITQGLTMLGLPNSVCKPS